MDNDKPLNYRQNLFAEYYAEGDTQGNATQSALKAGYSYKYADQACRWLLGNNRIKVKTRYNAEGIGWSIKGLSNYYIFEKSGDSWLLVDTNFHKMSVGSVLKVIGMIFGTFGLVFLLLFIFWLWMLIDCATREFEDKVIWIIIIIFLNILGAILYFFIIRRKLKKQPVPK